jgi:glycosyltransferase involved in cell wall biosynthesis
MFVLEIPCFMKILYVSQSVLPLRSAAAFVTDSFTNAFTKDEMAVFGERALFFKKPAPRGGNFPTIYRSPTELSLWGRGRRFFLALRWLLFPLMLWQMNRVIRKEKIDYILCTYPDNYYLYGSYLLAKWKKMGYSSYFHNCYIENRKKGSIHYWFANKIQPRIFEYCDYIFVMSEGLQAYYQREYPEVKKKFLPLIHTFEDFPDLTPNTDFKADHDNYRLVFIGNFNESNIEATTRLVNALKRDPRYQMKFFTQVPKFLLKNRGIDVDAIDYRGFIAQEDFYKELLDNDFCILTHGFTGGYDAAEYETIFPTRSIQFFISGLPIFAHSPSHAFLTHFLRKYDCAVVVDEASEDAVLEAMNKLVADPERKKELAANARKAAAMFYAPNVANYLREKVEAALKGQPELAEVEV